MDDILRLVFELSALLSVVGIGITVILSPKPVSALDHLRGLSRYTMLAGATFGAVACHSGWVPPWHSVLLVLGMASAMAVYARGQHQQALAAENDAAHPVRSWFRALLHLLTGKTHFRTKE